MRKLLLVAALLVARRDDDGAAQISAHSDCQRRCLLKKHKLAEEPIALETLGLGQALL